jgi:ligand-binding sensor domain-containing protein
MTNKGLKCNKAIFTIGCFLGQLLMGVAQVDSLVFYPVNNPALHQYDIRADHCNTKDGKLWLSTGNGLLLYDGNDIQVFFTKEKDSLSLSGHSLSSFFR